MPTVSYSSLAQFNLFPDSFMKRGFFNPDPVFEFVNTGDAIIISRAPFYAGNDPRNVNPVVTIMGNELSVDGQGQLSGHITDMVLSSDNRGEIAVINDIALDASRFSSLLNSASEGNQAAWLNFEYLLGDVIGTLTLTDEDEIVPLTRIALSLDVFDLAGGDDYINAYTSAFDGVVDGGAGRDTLVVAGAYDDTGVVLDIENGFILKDGHETKFKNFEVYYGNRSVETYLGSDRAEEITADSLDDLIYGGGGADRLIAGWGNDRVYSGSGADTVLLGPGDDYARVGGGEEYFDGGEGVDYISYYDSSNGVTVNLATNTVSGSWAVNDTVLNFEGISGSKTGNDKITGTEGANVIRTYGGKDKVYAGRGNDKVELGTGDDYVRVGGGVETFDGGAGSDYISYVDSRAGIKLDLRADTVTGSWGNNDTIKDFENASGSKTGDDDLRGTSGDNRLRGYGGDDKFYGRSGDDLIDGGSGEDWMDGGHGFDTLIGGSGADVFHFDAGEGDDVITDFENNIDTIELDGFVFPQEVGSDDPFDYATEIGADVLFDFGKTGTLLVENTTINQLLNDLELV